MKCMARVLEVSSSQLHDIPCPLFTLFKDPKAPWKDCFYCQSQNSSTVIAFEFNGKRYGCLVRGRAGCIT